MNYDEMLQAALPRMEGYEELSEAAKGLLPFCEALDLKNIAECRARLDAYQKEAGLDDVTLWGTVVLAAHELTGAGFVKQAVFDIDKKLLICAWSDAVRKKALEAEP